MRSIAYFIREALKNSQKNFSTTLGAVVTIFLSLLVIGVFMVTSIIINNVITDIEDDVSLQIFIADEADMNMVTELQSYAAGLEEVLDDGVVFVTKEEAIKRLSEMPKYADIAEQLDDNPLPASLEIKLADPEQVAAVAEKIQAHEVFMQVVDTPEDITQSVKYGEDYVDILFTVSNIIRIVTAALVILLIFVALIFINNTIRLAIMARRKEIAIMRLVGASNGFIRGPFLMEGTLQALVGAGLAIGAVSLICSFGFDKLMELVPAAPLAVSQPSLWLVYILMLVIGLVIGLFGSIWSMRRYLKV